jgi:hypothetical protein
MAVLTVGKCAPQTIYIKGIHSTDADAVLWLEYNPELTLTNEYTHTMLGVSTKEENKDRNLSCITSKTTTKALPSRKLSALQ